jgi:hypothetical protein
VPHQQQWFATSRFGPQRNTGLEHKSVSLVHAKRLGTTTSACGLETTSWFKHWEPFASVTSDRTCPDCVRAILSSMRRPARDLSARGSA